MTRAAATRRTTVALLIASALLAVSASSALAGDVTVSGPRGGPSTTVSLASLADKFDVDADYELRDASGSAQPVHVKGISVAALLAAINADPVYGGVEVLRADQSKLLVSKSQIVAGAPSPVVYEDAAGVHFLRPSYGSTDANAGDVVTAAGNLTLRQTDSSQLQVEARASKTSVRARKAVTFSATASGAGAGEQYTYKWNFDDGTTATGAKVTHRYAKRGRYDVLVTVTTAGSDRSDPDVVSVQVGDPAKSKQNRSGGGTNQVAGAPDSGASDGSSGSGTNAATTQTEASAPVTKRRRVFRAAPAGEQVTGQLLSATIVAAPHAASTLGARSGQQIQKAPAIGIPGEAMGIGGVAALLGIGFMLELGTFGKLATRIRPGG